MKITDLFKKVSSKKAVNSSVLSKEQLGKVVGGADTLDTTTTSTTDTEIKKHIAGVKYGN